MPSMSSIRRGRFLPADLAFVGGYHTSISAGGKPPRFHQLQRSFPFSSPTLRSGLPPAQTPEAAIASPPSAVEVRQLRWHLFRSQGRVEESPRAEDRWKFRWKMEEKALETPKDSSEPEQSPGVPQRSRSHED